MADDHDGELYISDLNQSGVNFQSARPEPGVTGKCVVMVTSDAERTMNTFPRCWWESVHERNR